MYRQSEDKRMHEEAEQLSVRLKKASVHPPGASQNKLAGTSPRKENCFLGERRYLSVGYDDDFLRKYRTILISPNISSGASHIGTSNVLREDIFGGSRGLSQCGVERWRSVAFGSAFSSA